MNAVLLLITLLFAHTLAQTCTTTDVVNVRSCAGTSASGCSVVRTLSVGTSVSVSNYNNMPYADGYRWANIGNGDHVAAAFLSCSSSPSAPNPSPSPSGNGGSLVSASQFSCMFPRVSSSKISTWLPYLNTALQRHGINTLARVQMFMAQTGHETDGYNTFSEYTNRDGTNAWCHNYNGGCRYRGRGAIQLTHKYNYQKAGNQLGVDFVNNPDVVATPQYAFEVGGMFWSWNSLNTCSDSRDLYTCTRKINGGTNGMADRQTRYSLAQRCITSVGRATQATDSVLTVSDSSSATLSSAASAAVISLAVILGIGLLVTTVMLLRTAAFLRNERV